MNPDVGQLSDKLLQILIGDLLVALPLICCESEQFIQIRQIGVDGVRREPALQSQIDFIFLTNVVARLHC